MVWVSSSWLLDCHSPHWIMAVLEKTNLSYAYVHWIPLCLCLSNPTLNIYACVFPLVGYGCRLLYFGRIACLTCSWNFVVCTDYSGMFLPSYPFITRAYWCSAAYHARSIFSKWLIRVTWKQIICKKGFLWHLQVVFLTQLFFSLH